MAKAKEATKVKTAKASENETPPIGNFQIRVMKESEDRITIKMDNVRLTWVYLSKPQEGENGHRYSVTALIPKNADNLTVFKTVAQKICKASPKFIKADRKKVYETSMSLDKYSLLRDGNKRVNDAGEPYPGCSGHYTLTAKMTAKDLGDGKFAPEFDLPVVRADKSEIQKHEMQRELYSGVYASIVVTISAYNSKGNAGLTTYLVAVQKLVDAPKLGGTSVDYFDKREDLDVSASVEFDEDGF
jgi:hypothetical protein